MSFLNSLKKSLNQAGNELSRGVDSVSKSVNNAVNENWSSATLDMFRTANVIQLVSRVSGKCLEIVAGPGGLAVDGLGPEGIQAFHTHWTVTNLGKNIVTLSNQTNYLSILDGMTKVMNFPDPMYITVETHLRVVQIGNFICLESVKQSNAFVGVMHTGELKSAIATNKTSDGQWAIRLIHDAHAATATPCVKEKH